MVGHRVMELAGQHLSFVESGLTNRAFLGCMPVANRGSELRREQKEDCSADRFPETGGSVQETGPRKKDHQREAEDRGAARPPPHERIREHQHEDGGVEAIVYGGTRDGRGNTQSSKSDERGAGHTERMGPSPGQGQRHRDHEHEVRRLPYHASQCRLDQRSNH